MSPPSSAMNLESTADVNVEYGGGLKAKRRLQACRKKCLSLARSYVCNAADVVRASRLSQKLFQITDAS